MLPLDQASPATRYPKHKRNLLTKNKILNLGVHKYWVPGHHGNSILYNDIEYMWVPHMEFASCHTIGFSDFEVATRFLEILPLLAELTLKLQPREPYLLNSCMDLNIQTWNTSGHQNNFPR